MKSLKSILKRAMEAKVYSERKAALAAGPNDPEKQYHLAYCHHYGVGTKGDHKRAYDLYLKAADQGYLDAVTQIGLLFLAGRGMKKDPLRALALFEMMGDKGNLTAKYAYAKFVACPLYQHQGFPFNVAKAAHWLEDVANQADHFMAAKKPVPSFIVGAIHDLGEVYLTGDLGRVDIPKARALLQKARLLGHDRLFPPPRSRRRHRQSSSPSINFQR